jgi:hypothetical protein
MAANLEEIRKKVRRLTRSPSESQLSTTDLDDYINTFILYDFPESLRLSGFRTKLTFYTQPNVDVYDTNTIRAADPLYNFKNAYITSHDPMYVAGYRAYFTQDRYDFFNIYPRLQAETRIGTGDNATTNFTGTLSGRPLLQNAVMFTSVDADNRGVVLSDVPRLDADGNPSSIGDLIWPDEAVSRGTINYITGVYDITFPYAPATSKPVIAQTVVYQAARPQGILYFDNKFTVRPVPDKSYAIDLETYIRPTALLDAADEPKFEQHWQYIALGAARLILQDRLDMETLAAITPEFDRQECLVLRKTLVQQSNQRTSTIYSPQLDNTWTGWRWFNN